MNSIIQKCLDELKKEKPSIEYAKGLLEAVLVMSAAPTTYTAPVGKVVQPVAPEEQVDEKSELLDKYEHGRIGKIAS